jgi:hypothetical protein
MGRDRVLTVNDYYDGPRLGIAELDGAPHIYEAEFDHSADEYGDTYFLSPAEPELVASVLEDWEIWLRWQAAYKRGEVPHETHPALPAERERHEQLKNLIADRLKSNPDNRRHFKAAFTNAAGVMYVRWEAQ